MSEQQYWSTGHTNSNNTDNDNDNNTGSSYMAPDTGSARTITAAAAMSVPAATTRDPTWCLYRSKTCNNPRAVKLNGELHLLCNYHRRRANLNQQRVHQRRKIRMKQRNSSASESESWEFLEPCSSPCGDLTAHDLKILEILLFYSNSPSPSRRDSIDSTASSNSSSVRATDTVDAVASKVERIL